MTPGYDDYRKALAQLKDLPSRMAADLEQAKKTHNQATALADNAVTAADAAAADTTKAVEAQLAAARSALEPLGKSNLIPPRTVASGSKTAATRADVAEAQQALAAAVNKVRYAVKAEVERTEAENQRLAREAIERERRAREAAERAAAAAARRKKLIQASAATALALVILIVILIAVL